MKNILVCFLLLTSCTNHKLEPVVLTEKNLEAKKTVNIDEELLKECGPLPKFTVTHPTPEDILKQKAKDVLAYKECRLRHSKLSKIVRDAFNIK